MATTHVINLTPTYVLHDKTLYECLYGVSPTYDNIRVFDCLCYITNQPHTSDKFDPKSRRCIFFGYAFGKKVVIYLTWILASFSRVVMCSLLRTLFLILVSCRLMLAFKGMHIWLNRPFGMTTYMILVMVWGGCMWRGYWSELHVGVACQIALGPKLLVWLVMFGLFTWFFNYLLVGFIAVFELV